MTGDCRNVPSTSGTTLPQYHQTVKRDHDESQSVQDFCCELVSSALISEGLRKIIYDVYEDDTSRMFALFTLFCTVVLMDLIMKLSSKRRFFRFSWKLSGNTATGGHKYNDPF